MARIEGTGKSSRRRRLPRVRLDSLVVVTVLSPIVLLAPEIWLQAVFLACVLLAAWSVGHHDGIEDMAREVERELRRDDRGA